MVTCLKINTVMGGFKLLESHNRSVSDLYFTISALLIMFYIAACIHYSCNYSNTERVRCYKCDHLRQSFIYLKNAIRIGHFTY